MFKWEKWFEEKIMDKIGDFVLNHFVLAWIILVLLATSPLYIPLIIWWLR